MIVHIQMASVYCQPELAVVMRVVIVTMILNLRVIQLFMVHLGNGETILHIGFKCMVPFALHPLEHVSHLE